jgi:hypothetical protein
MKHRFVIRDKDQLFIFDNYIDIPEEFDHVIEFRPYVPPGPHTPEQHEEAHKWTDRLQELMRRERASSNKNR